MVQNPQVVEVAATVKADGKVDLEDLVFLSSHIPVDK
tara:strand:- start:37 stop:147 length:111 start_codon:yes stop_codon:yes gene_type:complete